MDNSNVSHRYAAVLRHSVEEVVEGCLESLELSTAAKVSKLRSQVLSDLQGHVKASLVSDNGDLDLPRKLTLMEWIQEAKQSNALVFLAGMVFDILGI